MDALSFGLPDSTRRRVCIAGLSTLALLAAVGGVAWACGPNRAIQLSASSGPPGREATVSGANFPPGSPIELHFQSASGPLVAVTTGPEFSVPFTFPDARGAYLLVAVVRDSQGGELFSSPISFEVTAPPALTLTPGAGPRSSRVAVRGSGFGDGPVEVRWDSEEGARLATTPGPGFSLSVAVPAAAPGRHRIVAVGRDTEGRLFGRASTPFDVTEAGRPAPRPDYVGPAVRGAALSSANRFRTVSPRGYVSLFCGRFEEDGVTGACGARSVGSLRLGPPALRSRARRRMVLRLANRSFKARKGRAVRVRFRLSRRSMAVLRRERTVRMRGRVASRDRLGNRSAASFRFALRAPRKQWRARASAESTRALAGW